MAGIGARVALAVGSTLTTLVVLEAVFRIASISTPELSADAIWEVQEPELPTGSETRLTLGEATFRQARINLRIMEPGWRRILFLGDSFTEGAGVPNDDDRFVDRVVRALDEEGRDTGRSEGVHAFNGALSGSFPVQWLEVYRALQPVYQPGLVVAVFFLRDGAPLSTSLRLNREIIDPIRVRYRQLPLHGHSALLRFVYDKLAWREYTGDFKRRLIASYLGSEEEQATWREQQEALLAIARDCHDQGLAFHLVIFPLLIGLDDYEFFEVEKAISDFAQRHGIPVFTLTSGFLGREDHTLWVASNDQHPNEEGHRIAAETLLPYLREVITALPAEP